MNNKNTIILLFLLINYMCSAFSNTIENSDFKLYKFKAVLNKANDVDVKSINDDKIINGSINGRIDSALHKTFSNAKLQCEILGRSYKGRVFSCGFAEVEDLKGYCQFIMPKSEDLLLTYLECTTTAGLNGDAMCKGKVNVLQGFGNLAGVIGFGEVEMPLIKSLMNKNISYPMKWTLKIKHPLALKKIN
tara:strand:+ start:1422 stop:1991 length:570 start_codon:yes stop_codon:yes gene_type:complete